MRKAPVSLQARAPHPNPLLRGIPPTGTRAPHCTRHAVLGHIVLLQLPLPSVKTLGIAAATQHPAGSPSEDGLGWHSQLNRKTKHCPELAERQMLFA